MAAPAPSPRWNAHNGADCVVYFAQRQPDGAVKIGHTRNIRTRLADLRKTHKCKLVLLGTMPGGRVVERAVHFRFASQAIGREWFRPAPEILAFAAKPTNDNFTGGNGVVADRGLFWTRENMPVAGEKFGLLAVIGWLPAIDRYGIRCLCRCACGARVVRLLAQMHAHRRAGHEQGCGGCGPVRNRWRQGAARIADRRRTSAFRRQWHEFGALIDDAGDLYNVAADLPSEFAAFEIDRDDIDALPDLDDYLFSPVRERTPLDRANDFTPHF